MTVVGSINADVVLDVSRLPLPGETLIADSIDVHPGGKGANQAVAAARLGAAVAFIGAVGTDAYAATAVAGLREAGVDIDRVAVVPGPTGQAYVTVDGRTGENSIVVVSGANGHVNEALVRSHEDLLGRTDIVVLQGEISAEAIAAAAASSRTARLVLNLAPVIPLGHEVIRRADPLVVNEHEGRLVLNLLGRGADELGTEEDIVGALHAAGVPAVVMTLGAAGAIFSEGGPVFRAPAPAVSAVDTTGAGDAFVGALCARLSDGAPLGEAVRFAVRVGSFAVTRRGAQPSYPGPGDVLPEGAR
nr:ribokinase [Corynebacterium cyclohexanicum]